MRLIFVIFGFIALGSQAQELIPGLVDNGKAYIEYRAGNGETLFGISRIYALEPKVLAAFNNLDMKTGLKKDQVLKIPLTSANLSLTACSNCSKVIYKVQAHEGIYRIGVNFANVGMTALKKLNNLPLDNVSIDQELLVGYVKTGSGAIVMQPAVKPETTTMETVPASKTVAESVQPPKPVFKPVEEKKPEIITPKPVVKPAEIPVAKTVEMPAGQTKEAVVETKPADAGTSPGEPIKSAFETQYNPKTGAASTGIASAFKTSSGWSDARYYALMSNVEPGTIVKITAKSTNRSVFAKVLGEMPVIRENEGLLLRISDAASGVLGAGEEHIEVTVSY